MKQNRIRMLIFGLWLSFLLLNILGAELGPVIRRDGSIQYAQISPILFSIIGIYVPALSCLAGFWFPKTERTQAGERTLPRERGIVAVGITLVYLVIVLILVLWPIFVTSYASEALELPKGESLSDRMGDAVKIATMLSFLPLAPIHYLTSKK